jgi:hypothetical protein
MPEVLSQIKQIETEKVMMQSEIDVGSDYNKKFFEGITAQEEAFNSREITPKASETIKSIKNLRGLIVQKYREVIPFFMTAGEREKKLEIQFPKNGLTEAGRSKEFNNLSRGLDLSISKKVNGNQGTLKKLEESSLTNPPINENTVSQNEIQKQREIDKTMIEFQIKLRNVNKAVKEAINASGNIVDFSTKNIFDAIFTNFKSDPVYKKLVDYENDYNLKTISPSDKGYQNFKRTKDSMYKLLYEDYSEVDIQQKAYESVVEEIVKEMEGIDVAAKIYESISPIVDSGELIKEIVEYKPQEPSVNKRASLLDTLKSKLGLLTKSKTIEQKPKIDNSKTKILVKKTSIKEPMTLEVYEKLFDIIQNSGEMLVDQNRRIAQLYKRYSEENGNSKIVSEDSNIGNKIIENTNLNISELQKNSSTLIPENENNLNQDSEYEQGEKESERKKTIELYKKMEKTFKALVTKGDSKLSESELYELDRILHIYDAEKIKYKIPSHLISALLDYRYHFEKKNNEKNSSQS